MRFKLAIARVKKKNVYIYIYIYIYNYYSMVVTGFHRFCPVGGISNIFYFRNKLFYLSCIFYQQSTHFYVDLLCLKWHESLVVILSRSVWCPVFPLWPFSHQVIMLFLEWHFISWTVGMLLNNSTTHWTPCTSIFQASFLFPSEMKHCNTLTQVYWML